MLDSREVFEWLVDGAPGAAGAPDVVLGLGERLVAAGVPLDRIAAFVRTLHPQVMGRQEAFAALADLNTGRAARGDDPLRFGIALHPGDVEYGNIGSAGRLDFTCIGPAVNLAARLEGITGRLDRPLVVSDEFARLSTRPTVCVGTFELKGVPEPRAVHAPAPGQPLAAWGPSRPL